MTALPCVLVGTAIVIAAMLVIVLALSSRLIILFCRYIEGI